VILKPKDNLVFLPFTNETYSNVPLRKYVSKTLPIQNGMNQGDVLSPLLFKVALGYVIRKVQENGIRLKSVEGDKTVGRSYNV
jgi:hypothetical protein